MRTKDLFKGVLFLLLISVFVSCGPSSRILNQSEWQANKERKINTEATIFISNVDFKAHIVSASDEKIAVEQNGVKSDLPAEAISKIIFTGDDSKKKKIIWGSVIGGALGIAGGYAVGSAASDKGGATAIAHPVSMVIILGGIVGGGFAGSSLTKHEEYSFTSKLNPYILDDDLGLEITPAELRGYSLFENLQGDPDEKILQVQIFTLAAEKYFLLYDVGYLGSYMVRWQIVDENYIQTQKAKIKTQK